MEPPLARVRRRVVLGEREPAARPSDQDGLVLDLGTSYGINLEAAEQGFGIKCGGLRPQWFRRCGAPAPDTVRRQGGTCDRLHAWVVDSHVGVVGVRGQERGLGWPYLGALCHGSGEPLSDAIDTLRMLYLAGEVPHACGDGAYRGRRAGVVPRAADGFYILRNGDRREERPGFRQSA